MTCCRILRYCAPQGRLFPRTGETGQPYSRDLVSTPLRGEKAYPCVSQCAWFWRNSKDQRFNREGEDCRSRNFLVRPRAFAGCERFLGRRLAGLLCRSGEKALIVT